MRKRPFDSGEKQAPRFGRKHAFGSPLEQQLAHYCFQLRQSLGDRRLTDMDGLSGRRNAAQMTNGRGSPQVAKVEIGNIHFSHY